jgi:hypothetical protein
MGNKMTMPEIDEKIREVIMQKTPSERIEMGCAMFEVFRQSIIQDILKENPNITDNSLRQQVFLKLYENEFSVEELQKILAGLARCQTPFKR